jgi:hypothetical protein
MIEVVVVGGGGGGGGRAVGGQGGDVGCSCMKRGMGTAREAVAIILDKITWESSAWHAGFNNNQVHTWFGKVSVYVPNAYRVR